MKEALIRSTSGPDDFAVDLKKRTARHRPCGTTFLFYNYESLDGLQPHLVSGKESRERPSGELVDAATKAFRAAAEKAGRRGL